MGLRRLAISNPSANTDTTLFTADNQYLLSVLVTNTSASSSSIRIWVQPSGSSTPSQYAFIAYDLPITANSSSETFKFAVNQNDLVRIRANSASVSFQAYGLVQYDVNLGVGISSFQSASPTSTVDGLIWIDAAGVISGSSAKPAYVWSNSSNDWLPFAGGQLNTAGTYVWTGSNTFNGITTLSSSTSIGSVSSTEISYLDNVTSNIQTQLNSKANSASPSLTGIPTAPTAAVDTNTTQIATTAYVVGQGYAKLASPALSGTPTAPTAAAGTNTTQIATTAYVANNFEKTIPLQASAPSSPSSSDLWVDNSGSAPVLKVYNGTTWVSLTFPADDDQNILASRVFG